MSSWTQKDAIALCREVEKIAPSCGCHVALTGGCLYKEGPRKDLDLLFYRIRPVKEINMPLLWQLLESVCGVVKKSGFGWCYKAQHNIGGVDCFFPEEQDGTYEAETERETLEKQLPKTI